MRDGLISSSCPMLARLRSPPDSPRMKKPPAQHKLQSEPFTSCGRGQGIALRHASVSLQAASKLVLVMEDALQLQHCHHAGTHR